MTTFRKPKKLKSQFDITWKLIFREIAKRSQLVKIYFNAARNRYPINDDTWKNNNDEQQAREATFARITIGKYFSI